MRNILAIALLLNITLNSMDRFDDRKDREERGRSRERIYRIDPEFAEFLQSNQPHFPDINIELSDQQVPYKFKKSKTGCMPNLHLARIASMVFHRYFIK